MQLARPIGLALSQPLLERLDAIARAERLSRSSVARTFLLNGLAEYERDGGPSSVAAASDAPSLRAWRPRPPEANGATLPASKDGSR